jgi:hypothetical protein
LAACAATLATFGLVAVGASPANAACPYLHCGNTDRLYAGDTLPSGDWVTSSDGVFTFDVQTDSNLVMVDANNKPLWATNTAAKPDGAWLLMQADGNLVMYRAGGTCGCGSDAYWSSGTAGHPGASFVMGTDGNAAVVLNGSVLWSTHTAPFPFTVSLTETAYAKPDKVTSVGVEGTGATVHIVCQTNVGADTGHGYNTRGNFTWDHISEGGWIPDFYVNTPLVGVDGFSVGVPRCHRSGPLTATSFLSAELGKFPVAPTQTTDGAWVDSSINTHTIGPLFNDGGDYWQSVPAESTSSALGAGNCQDLVLANNNFWWLFDPANGAVILNNVDTWGPDSAGGKDVNNGVTYHGYGRTWTTSNPLVGDIVVFGHGTFTPSGHVAVVVRVDNNSTAPGFVVAEMNVHQNGGGNGILDFRKINNGSSKDNVIAFIR